MKARESGMPEKEIWERFFDVPKIFSELEITQKVERLVDFGCGYGTFTIPVSTLISGEVYAFDIEDSLIHELDSELKINHIKNVCPIKRDFISEGTGLLNEDVDYVMLFNILHSEMAESILDETYRILKKNGKVGVIHWKYDSSTPRGPSMGIRPKPEQLKDKLIKSGFSILKYDIDLPPYHYGILAQK